MEKTLISWNVPNFVSVNIMLLLGWLVIALVYALVTKVVAPGSSTASNSGQY